MGADDDADCAEHEWMLTGVALVRGGAQTEYVCVHLGCDAVLFVTPDEVLPGTV